MSAAARRRLGARARRRSIVVMVNQRDVGIARDEIVYMSAGARYAALVARHVTRRSASRSTQTWGGPLGGGNNPEHPPFVKTLMGCRTRRSRGMLGVDEVTAYRLPSAVLHGVLRRGSCTAMTLALWGFAEAILAALLPAAPAARAVPRRARRVRRADHDAVVRDGVRVLALSRRRKWPWQVGVAFGLALATKHTALLLPFALGVHYVVARVAREQVRSVHWRVARRRSRCSGRSSLFALWPLAVVRADRARRARGSTFHMHHVHYNFEYLGTNWNAPRFPWHVALVTTLFTVPVATLAAAIAGAGVWIARRAARVDRERAPVLLLALSAAASIGPFFLGIDADLRRREALDAGAADDLHRRRRRCGVGRARGCSRGVRARSRERVAIVGVVGGAHRARRRHRGRHRAPVRAHLVQRARRRRTGRRRPRHEPPVLGRRGARRAAVPRARSRPGPSTRTTRRRRGAGTAKLGLLPQGVPRRRPRGRRHRARASYAIVIHEKHFNRHDYLIWKSYGTVQPVFVLRADGVPIVSVYKRTMTPAPHRACYVLMRPGSPTALVIRQGPSRTFCTISWNLARDHFEVGQWVKHKLYPERGDISPDGKWHIYFALNGEWSSETKGSWTGLAKAPYVKCIKMWPQGDTWGGGGLLYRTGDVPRAYGNVPPTPPLPPQFRFVRGTRTERLQRDGWTRTRAGFEKPVGDWMLRKYLAGHGLRRDARARLAERHGARLPRMAVGRGRRASRAHRLRRGRPDLDRRFADPLREPHLLFDANGMTFEAIEAPY